MKYPAFLNYLVLFMTMLLFIGCATGESTISPAFHELNPEKVALVDVSGDIRGEAAKNQVEDYFIAEMIDKGYRVIERSRVNKVLDEQDFQRSDRTTNAEASEIGKVLNVPAVITLDANVDGEKVSVTGKMIDAETAEVLWVGTSRGGSGQGLATVGGAIGGALLGSQVGSGAGKVAGGVAGGVLGGAAGQTMSPQTARVVQKAIKQMVADLPDRK
ncbi:MAG: glycine zipper 2TM domain-containing protein [Desulfohalobiaceae bacterium]